jgi:integrase
VDVRGFLDHLAAAGCAPGTLRLRRHYLTRWAGRDQAATVAWLGNPGWAPETRKSARASVATYAAWAGLDYDLPAVKVPRALPRPCPEQAYRSAQERATPRVWLMLTLAGSCGLRRAEIASLRGEQLDGGWLYVTGKGGQVRAVPVPDDVAHALPATGWVFPSPHGGHLTADWVGRLIRDALGAGGHTLRHRYATCAYAGSHDLRAVQELLGHASPVTTARYTAVADQALVDAAAWAA